MSYSLLIISSLLHHLHHATFRKALPLLGSLTLGACHTDDPQPQPPRPVRTVTVSSTDHGSAYIITGEIRPREESALAFRTDGKIIARRVDVGNQVKRGDVIALLDPQVAENQLRSAQADLASAVAAERLTAVNLKRMNTLVSTGAIARMQLDEARANEDAAVARRESAQASLKNSGEQAGFTRLTSPADGIITRVNSNPGQVVSTGQEVVTLALLTGKDAVFNVPEPFFQDGMTDKSITVSLLSDPSVIATGQLRDVSPQADTTTRTWRVRVSLNAQSEKMPLGATVQGNIQRPENNTFVVPASALTRHGQQPAVYVVDPKKLTVGLKNITVVRYSASEIFISQGLSDGDRVVIAGTNKLRPDEKVTIEGDR